MDMPPPQAPPASVSSSQQALHDASQRLGDVQRWLARQQDALPDPSPPHASPDDFLADIDAFWAALVPGAPGEGFISRREAFTRMLIQASRDVARLQVESGALDEQVLPIIQVIARPSPTVRPSYVRAGEIKVNDLPIAGMLVICDDRFPGEVLLFTVSAGWEAFSSIDTLLADVEFRLRQHTTDDGEAVGTPSFHPYEAGRVPFGAVSEHLLSDFRTTLHDAWDDPDGIDALYRSSDLSGLLDPHAMLAATAHDAPAEATRLRRSPPLVVNGVAGRAIRTGAKQLPPLGGRIARIPFKVRARQAGIDLPGRATVSRGTTVLPSPDTLLSPRYIARDVSVPAGEVPMEGIYLIGGRRFIRQGDNLYGVRFDSGMGGWRLDRPGALDPRYSGPLVERHADGLWHYRRTGLTGGSGRPQATARRRISAPASAASEVNQLTAEQLRVLQGELTDRLGLNDGIDLYQRVMRRTTAGAETTQVTAREQGVWNEAMVIARTGRRQPSPPPAPSRNISPELADLSADEIRWMQRRLIRRLDFADGTRAFHEMAYRNAGETSIPAIPSEHVGLWNELLTNVRGRRLQMMPPSPPTPPATPAPVRRVKSFDTEDFTSYERTKLRNQLNRRLGPEQGAHVYGEMAFQQTDHIPALPDAQRTAWDEIVSTIRNQRGQPRSRQTIVPDLADLRPQELASLRDLLKDRLGELDGDMAYRSMALTPSPNSPTPVLTAIQRNAWDEALSDVRARRIRPYNPTLSLSSDLADLSMHEQRMLRTELKRRLNYYPGEALYQDMAYLPAGSPVPSAVSTDKLATWNDALAAVRGQRYLQPTATTARQALDDNLWFVPEDEWPDVVYHYAPRQTLETVGDSAIVLSQSQLSPGGASGIPLFSAAPETPLNQIAALADGWLPARARAPQDTIGSITGAWARIDLRAAVKGINGDAPSFELFRQGGPGSHAFMLRPTARNALAGTARHPLWLFEHVSVHLPSP